MADEEEDHFAPPADPVEVFCLHCGNVYSSSEIKFVPRADGPSFCNGLHGDWMCPAPGCDGVGYQFDIHSVDEWEDDTGDEEEDSFLDDDAFLVEDLFDDELAGDTPFDALEPPEFLPPPCEDPDDAYRGIVCDLNWSDTHDVPCVRMWQMRLDFSERRSRRFAEDPQHTYKPFNEDDIPF